MTASVLLAVPGSVCDIVPYLSVSRITILVVSHDTAWINRCCSCVYAL